MPFVSASVRINLEGLQRFRAQYDSPSGPIRAALKQWAARYRGFAQRRFDTFSKGGGDWAPLADATILARMRKSKSGRSRLRAKAKLNRMKRRLDKVERDTSITRSSAIRAKKQIKRLGKQSGRIAKRGKKVAKRLTKTLKKKVKGLRKKSPKRSGKKSATTTGTKGVRKGRKKSRSKQIHSLAKKAKKSVTQSVKVTRRAGRSANRTIKKARRAIAKHRKLTAAKHKLRERVAKLEKKLNSKKDAKLAILRDTGLLFGALLPVFKDSPGALQKFESNELAVVVGYGGPARHSAGNKSGKATIADIASFHQNGGPHLPARPIIVSPTVDILQAMASDMERALKKLGSDTLEK